MLRQPLANYHFRLLFGEDYLILTENTASVRADFAARIVEIEMRDSRDNMVARAVIEYIKGDRFLCWECMDGKNDHPTRSHTFTGLVLEQHSYGQDYTKAEHVIQVLVFSYEDCDTEFYT